MLSALFIADHCKFFGPIALKEAVSRLKRRHAIFESWRTVLDKDFGTSRPEGLPSLAAPPKFGSMSDHELFLLFDCTKSCHRCGLRTFPSFGCPSVLGSGKVTATNKMGKALSHVCRPSCGSPIHVLESDGPPLSTDAFYYMPQLYDWPVYGTVSGLFTLFGDFVHSKSREWAAIRC